MSIVVCHRDPDASNDFFTFGDEVEIIDIDYGRVDLHDPVEFKDWRDGLLTQAIQLWDRGTEESRAAYQHIVNALAEATVNYGHSYHGE